jgi:plastocyanin
MKRLFFLFTLAAAAPAHADIVTVNQINLIFTPADITINEGDTVRWVWNNGNHTVTEGSDLVVDGNEAFNYVLRSDNPIVDVVFDAAFLAANPRPNDRYDYFCEPHVVFGMVGVVNVIRSGEPGTAFCSGDGSGTACPCNNAGASGEGCANGTGAGAKLSSSGSTSVSAGDLVLAGSQLVPGQPGLYFQGNNAVNSQAGAVFGDGLRCAGGGVVRLQVRMADGSGASATTVNIGAVGGVAAGTTRRYQLWYRDPSSSPCGTGFNLSNGVEVVFTP